MIYLPVVQYTKPNMAQVSTKPCEICEQAPGTHFCLDCEQYYCDNCKVLHKKQKYARSHEFQLATEVIPEVKSKCDDHNETYTFFCKTCNVPVCSRCVTGKHNGHKFSAIHDFVTEFREANSLKLEPKIRDLERNIKNVSSGLQKFEGEVAHVIRAIEQEGNRMKAMIDLCIAEKIKSVQDKSKQEKMNIERVLNSMKTELKSMQTMDTERKMLEKARPDGALIKKLQALQIDIDQLTPTKPPDIPSITCVPGKVKENDVKQLLGTFVFRFVTFKCKENTCFI